MRDLTTLLDENARREAALRGSRHYAPSSPRWDGPLPDAQPSRERPTLRWPVERHLVPPACWNCGAKRANFEDDPPCDGIRHGEIRCLTCSRVVVNLEDGGATALRDAPPLPSQPVIDNACNDCGNDRRMPDRSYCHACHRRRKRQADAARVGVTP
jgi:hypothetical protein